jgi:TPP-dependent pyruvate/acetoin dehydrogenase alpha subunit
MEQRLESPLVEIQVLMKAGLKEIKASLKALVDADLEKAEAKMKTNQEKMEAIA